MKRVFRMTPQRRIILEELENSHSHPTADELYEKVKRRLPRISLGTVYRNLEILASEGVIRKLDLCGTQRRFDAGVELHYHVRCLQCGALEDVTIEPDARFRDMLKETKGYEVCDVRLEFLGFCPRCRPHKSALHSVMDGCN
jgi:Fur family ferric uptake transcriptional regulator